MDSGLPARHPYQNHLIEILPGLLDDNVARQCPVDNPAVEDPLEDLAGSDEEYSSDDSYGEYEDDADNEFDMSDSSSDFESDFGYFSDYWDPNDNISEGDDGDICDEDWDNIGLVWDNLADPLSEDSGTFDDSLYF